MFISYAQNFEDVILNRVFADKEKGCYIDVGAQHPLYDSVTKAFYDRGWQGINIEPVKEYYELLVKERAKDLNLNLAVGETESELDFFELEGTGLSTFDREAASRLAEEGDYNINSYRVPVVKLATVCEEHLNGPIDFLKIDVEGWEEKVILGNDWAHFRPTVILLEATIPNSPTRAETNIHDILQGQNYQKVYFDGLNDYYLANESSELIKHFATPPNVFDKFITYHLSTARSHAQNLEEIIKSREVENESIQQQLAQKEQELSETQQYLAQKEQELATTQQRLEQQQQTLTTTQQQLAQQQQALATNEQQLEQQQQQLAATQQQLEHKQQELVTTQQQLEQQQQALATNEQQLEQQQQELATTQQKLEYKQQELATTQQHLEHKQQQLAESERHNHIFNNRLKDEKFEVQRLIKIDLQLNQEITQLQNKLTNQNQQLAKSQQQLVKSQQQLQESERNNTILSNKLEDTSFEAQKVTELNQEINQLQSQLTAKNQQLTAKDQQLIDATQLIAAMKTSKFWKMRTVWFGVKNSLGIPNKG
ncbi:MAG: FkbM family methyltransferase [Cyanobacteria bacterium P01_F01_bin.143]